MLERDTIKCLVDMLAQAMAENRAMRENEKEHLDTIWRVSDEAAKLRQARAAERAHPLHEDRTADLEKHAELLKETVVQREALIALVDVALEEAGFGTPASDEQTRGIVERLRSLIEKHDHCVEMLEEQSEKIDGLKVQRDMEAQAKQLAVGDRNTALVARDRAQTDRDEAVEKGRALQDELKRMQADRDDWRGRALDANRKHADAEVKANTHRNTIVDLEAQLKHAMDSVDRSIVGANREDAQPRREVSDADRYLYHTGRATEAEVRADREGD